MFTLCLLYVFVLYAGGSVSVLKARIGRRGCSYRSARMLVSVDADGESTKKDRVNVVVHMLGLSVLCITNRVLLVATCWG